MEVSQSSGLINYVKSGVFGLLPIEIEASLELRGASSADSSLIAEWLNKKEIKKYLSSSIRSREIPCELIEVTLKRRDQSWVIVSKNDRPVGLLVFDQFDVEDSIANLWYCLGDFSMRGQHIMPTAINMLLAAPTLPVQVVTAWVGSNNLASLNCLKRAGFHCLGRIRNSFRVDGVHDRIIFEKQINLNEQ